MVYTRGASADYDRWAELVGDGDWKWEKTKERSQKIESFRADISSELRRYANPDMTSYGTQCLLPVSLPSVLESESEIVFEAARELGYPTNLDHNSGNPIGMSLAAGSSGDGLRSTSASAYLADKKVAKVILEGKTAVGIETTNGLKAVAKLEVILCAGAVDTPKLLLLSGIGPLEELNRHNIEVKHQLEGVGMDLQDHCGVFLAKHMGPNFSSRVGTMMSDQKMTAAREQWSKEKTGPLVTQYASACMAFVKEPKVFESEEFKSLDASVQGYLRGSTVPSFEIIANGPLVPPTYVFSDSDDGFLSVVIINMNPQSRGSIKLQSSDPEMPPLIDFAYMSHPYDRHILIEGVRHAMQFVKTRTISKYWKSSINVPKSEQEQDIWHANGSVVMDKANDKLACVDSELRIHGLQNIRVADLSVCPLTPNNHTQATAYLIGEYAAEKILQSHDHQLA
ncbi:hypothetical protein BZG36_03606, partial [Bifiguratus adelaidae]